MKFIAGFSAMATELVARAAVMGAAAHAGLEASAAHVERVAKSEFGRYQDAVGEFPAWPELAEATKDERVSLGFSENEPLLRTGDRRASISHEVGAMEAVIGSPDQLMAYHEFGTSNMPMRPVLGPAAVRSLDFIHRAIGGAVVSGLFGGEAIHEALGYNHDTRNLSD